MHLFAAIFLFLSTIAFGQSEVVYPAPESKGDNRFGDLIELLSLALKKTVPEYGGYKLVPSRLAMNEERSLAELKQGELVNVVWSSTSNEKETEFIPIRIPLRKGLLGYRIALIDPSNQALIDTVRTVDDLRKLNVGQGFGWGDVNVYKANGIPVATAGYESLFAMVSRDRFHLYPRGINEVFAEYAARRSGFPHLGIEKRLLLYYPWPYYFLVNRSERELAARIELGLRRMIKDGSFDAIFWKYNGAAIRQANLSKRRVIQLDNPLLPQETPLGSPYWLPPDKLKAYVLGLAQQSDDAAILAPGLLAVHQHGESLIKWQAHGCRTGLLLGKGRRHAGQAQRVQGLQRLFHQHSVSLGQW